jgi:hypothetical protein
VQPGLTMDRDRMIAMAMQNCFFRQPPWMDWKLCLPVISDLPADYRLAFADTQHQDPPLNWTINPFRLGPTIAENVEKR